MMLYLSKVFAILAGMWMLGAVFIQAADCPNVLLICFDDLRPVLGCYGGAAKTPHLDRFARSAVRFNRHYVQFPSCGPSRASMMSGVRPDTLNGWSEIWSYGSQSGQLFSKDRPPTPRHATSRRIRPIAISPRPYSHR